METTEMSLFDRLGPPPRVVVWSGSVRMTRLCVALLFVVLVPVSISLVIQAGSTGIYEARDGHMYGPLFSSTPLYPDCLLGIPLAVGLLIAGVAFAFEAGYRREYRLLRYGQVATARILLVESLTTFHGKGTYPGIVLTSDDSSPDLVGMGRHKTRYDSVEYVFQVSDVEYGGAYSVPQGLDEEPDPSGDRLAVLYDPDNPSNNKPYPRMTYVEVDQRYR